MNPDINYYYIGKMHPYEPDITCNTIDYIVFYGIFAYMCATLIDKNKGTIENKEVLTDEKLAFKINQYQLISLSISNNTAYGFIEDNTITDEKKQSILDNLLSMKSLERPYLLYYLFEYCDFKQYEEYYTKANFNLDETLELDTIFAIGDKQYNVNMGNLKFIGWVYYSGLYDFLMDNDKLKYEILTEMNSKGLLCGNVFLRYQLQDLLDFKGARGAEALADEDFYKDMPDLISQEEIDADETNDNDTENDTENSDDTESDDETNENYTENDEYDEKKLLYIKGTRDSFLEKPCQNKGFKGAEAPLAEALADEIDTTGVRFNSALVDDCISLFSKIKNTIGNISNRLTKHFIKYKTIYDIK